MLLPILWQTLPIMMPYKRLMVALDLTSKDEDVIRFTEYLSKVYRPGDVYFVHTSPDLESELDFSVRAPELAKLVKPADEELKLSMRHRIQRYFSNPGQSELHIDVLEGRPEKQLDHWAGLKHADLVVVGREPGSSDETVLVKRLARHLNSSVLILPTGTEPSVQRIVVPVDFSAESALALRRAMQIAERLDDVELCVLHIYDVPPGHFQLSRSAEQFERIMGANARVALEHFLQKNQAAALLGKAQLMPAEASNPSGEIHHYLLKNPADLVVMGAKGHSIVERFLVGSVAEGLINRHDKQAILIVKGPTTA